MTAARVERRLAAIKATDIVGYSRLIDADEAATSCGHQDVASRSRRSRWAVLSDVSNPIVYPLILKHGTAEAAVDRDRDAGDIGCFVAGEEGGDGAELGRRIP